MARKFKDFVVREKPKKRVRTHKKRLNKFKIYWQNTDKKLFLLFVAWSVLLWAM